MKNENIESKNAKLANSKHNATRAKYQVQKLIRKIEGMELDCDIEVYESLLRIEGLLAR